MPDFSAPHDDRREEPRNWSEAFAALPLEAPPRDAWAQVAAEIRATAPQRTSRNRGPWWTAMAAALALAVALPLTFMRDHGETPPHQMAATPARSPDAAQRDALQQPQASHPGLAETGSAPDGQPSASGLQAGIAAARDNRPSAKAARPRSATGIVQTTRPVETRIARAGPKPAQSAASTRPAADTALDTLYAQSAQLEALVAQMQDESFATGPAAVLAGELESRVALIDASLAQPELAAPQRTALWQERVDVLRQLADFESTQRLLAAEGERYDGQLVAVY